MVLSPDQQACTVYKQSNKQTSTFAPESQGSSFSYRQHSYLWQSGRLIMLLLVTNDIFHFHAWLCEIKPYYFRSCIICQLFFYRPVTPYPLPPLSFVMHSLHQLGNWFSNVVCDSKPFCCLLLTCPKYNMLKTYQIWNKIKTTR